MEFSLTGTPEIAPKLYWHNSANVLCNYMKKPEFRNNSKKSSNYPSLCD